MKKILSALLLACMATSAQATFATYTGSDHQTTPFTSVSGTTSLTARTFFLSVLSGVGVENFDSLVPNSPAPLSLSFSGVNTGGLTGSGCVSGPTCSALDMGRWATSGSNYLEAVGSFDISFATPVSAFGFYGTDIGDFGHDLNIELTDTNGNITEISVIQGYTPASTAPADYSLMFWGFIDTITTYSKIRFLNVGAPLVEDQEPTIDVFGFDDMVVGSIAQACTGRDCNVPEPGTLALLGLGLAGLGAMRRKQKAS